MPSSEIHIVNEMGIHGLVKPHVKCGVYYLVNSDPPKWIYRLDRHLKDLTWPDVAAAVRGRQNAPALPGPDYVCETTKRDMEMLRGRR